MRIGVNAVPLRVSGGGARYVFAELMDRLLTIDEHNQYIIFAHFLGLPVINQLPQVHTHLRAERSESPRVRVVEVGGEDDIFAYRDQFDLYFGPLNNLQPRIYDRPSVAILHDIQEQFFPHYFSPGDLAARREIYPEICRSATVLVTISEFCKGTIVEKFGVEPAKVAVMYNAPQSGLLERGEDDPGAWRRAPLPPAFFFYPANCYAHKNHKLLLDALQQQRAAGAAPLPVVFTGFELSGGFPLRAEIERRGLAELCRVIDEVAVDELRYLFRQAVALVMPSEFEGFGLPVVEAFACRCPVLCSDIPALREVAGNAALFFPADDPAALAARMAEVRGDPALRRRLIDAGEARARHFSWDVSARQMLEIFRDAPARFFGHHPQRRLAPRWQPRIGVLVSAPRGSNGLADTLKSIWATGYRNVSIRVAAAETPQRAAVDDFLRNAETPVDWLPPGAAPDYRDLLRLAAEEACDVVLELCAGHALLPTALHSLAVGYARDADAPVFVGEVWETQPARLISPGRTSPVAPAAAHLPAVCGNARLRLLGDGLWKIERNLYPEMLALAPANLARWEGITDQLHAAGGDWRWELLKAAHRQGRLSLLRRSLATCDVSQAALSAHLRAACTGVEAIYDADGVPQPGGWLQRLKPVLRPASRVLPESLRSKGRRIWRHLTNE